VQHVCRKKELMSKKILHIIHNDKFIIPFMDFVEAYFDKNEHYYVYLFDDNVVKYPIPEADNVLDICNKYPGRKNFFKLSKILTPLMEKAEKVILHGLFADDLVNYLYWHQHFLPKCHWIMWGGDLYGHLSPKRTWRNVFRIHRRYRVVEKMGHLVTYIKGDYELAQKHYGARGEYVECFMYPSNLYKSYDIVEEPHERINILVGNSADPSNNHFEVFEKLLPYKDENIHLIVPLSYSSQTHAKKVIEKGKALFGEKFEPLTEYMAFDAYLKLLGDVDMAIFAHDRQQAMGNMITLLGLGKKVYLKKDITPWKFFKDTGIEVYDVERIDLTSIEENYKTKNKEMIAQYFSKRNYISQLEQLFGA